MQGKERGAVEGVLETIYLCAHPNDWEGGGEGGCEGFVIGD